MSWTHSGMLMAMLMGVAAASDSDQLNKVLVEIANQHLPPGAMFAQIPELSPDGTQVQHPAVAIGSIGLGGSQYLAFVFRLNNALGLRVVSGAGAGAKIEDVSLPGSYVQTSSEALRGIMMKQLIPGGPLDIVVLTSNGASLGTYVNVYSFHRGQLRNVAGSTIEGSQIRLDCGTGKEGCKILAYGKWTDARSAYVHIYEWDGNAYVQTDRNAGKYALREAARLASEATGAEGVRPAMRVAVAVVAAAKFAELFDYDSSEKVCRDVLELLNKPLAGTEVVSATEIRNAKATLHEALGNIYAQAGRTSDCISRLTFH
jgi:hypothetical protein